MTRESKPSGKPGKSPVFVPPERGGLAAGLYILATPIGNARDISLRALEVLKVCDVIAAEDTRVTAKLLAIHGISRPLIPYNDHNGQQMRPQILSQLERGGLVALVSDAGTPLVSDPGYKLVREAIAAGGHILAVPRSPAGGVGARPLSGSPTPRPFVRGFFSPAGAAPNDGGGG